MREAERGSGWGERQGEAAQDDKAREDTRSGAPTGVCLSRGSPRPCLHPIPPASHLPSSVRHHGNRKPGEMIETLGGLGAAWDRTSAFRGTGSFSNKGWDDTQATTDRSDTRI